VRKNLKVSAADLCLACHLLILSESMAPCKDVLLLAKVQLICMVIGNKNEVHHYFASISEFFLFSYLYKEPHGFTVLQF
jgi:hypothetical protein